MFCSRNLSLLLFRPLLDLINLCVVKTHSAFCSDIKFQMHQLKKPLILDESFHSLVNN